MGFGANIEPIARVLASPEFEPVIKAMKKAGDAEAERHRIIDTMTQEMANLGFPEALTPRVGSCRPFPASVILSGLSTAW